jgi:hypothetical protein
VSHRPRSLHPARHFRRTLATLVRRNRAAGGRHRRTLPSTCATASAPAASGVFAHRPSQLPHGEPDSVHADGDGIGLVRPYVLAVEHLRYSHRRANSATRRLLIVTRAIPDLPTSAPSTRRQA